MALATLGNAASVGAIAKQVWDDKEGSTINKETDILRFFKVDTESFEGLQVNVVDRYDLGTGAVEMDEGGAFPDADNLKRLKRAFTTTELGLTAGITFKALNAARKKGKAAIVSAVKSEVEGRMEAFKRTLALRTATGGEVQGLINESKNPPSSAGACTVAAPNAGSEWWEYGGHLGEGKSLFANVVKADATTWVRVKLYGCKRGNTAKDYTEIPITIGGAGAGTPGLFVSDVDAANGKIELSIVNTAADAASFTTVGYVDGGYAAAVALHDTQYKDSLGADFGVVAKIPGTTKVFATNTMEGILTQLCTPTQNTQNRTGTSVGRVYQSHIRAQNTTTPQARTNPSPDRLESILAECEDSTGETPNLLVMNRLSAHSFLSVLLNTANYRAEVSDIGKGRLDIGATAERLRIMGYKLHFSQWWPRGIIGILSTKSWTNYVMEEPKVLTAVSPGTSAVGSFVQNRLSSNEWYIYADMGIFCRYPAQNILYCGFTW